ncbi:Putative membrane protein, clustering with ActP [hydrothermal vent metagenome]|uniref:Putative membrane protein, clustering with ActP n=1 Tax=hydrothermal vent metagenome TaxID=652676 RepID=A0A1W1ECY7_9ZZZZ
MTKTQIEQVKNNPKYQKLVRERSKFAWTLSIIMLVVYYAFIMTIAFDPSILGTKIGGGVITIGIPIGIAIIFIAFILAGIYVKRANGEFDQLTREVREELGDLA